MSLEEALWSILGGLFLGVLLIPLIVRLLWPATYGNQLRQLKEDVVHRYSNFANSLRARMRLIKSIEAANETYSNAEREFLGSYIEANRVGGYYSIGVNNISPTSPPNYDFTARVKMIVEEMTKSTEAANESRTAYENAVRQYNDALNDWRYSVYLWAKGTPFPRADYSPLDDDVLSGEFNVFS